MIKMKDHLLLARRWGLNGVVKFLICNEECQKETSEKIAKPYSGPG